MFWFQLWREFKLSIAEILSVFSHYKIVYLDKRFLILKFIDKKQIFKLIVYDELCLWWTIKIFEVEKNNDFEDFILKRALKSSSKFIYWVSVFWDKSNLKNILKSSKKVLKNNDISSRFVNKNFENLSSSQIFLKGLVNKKSDFTILNCKEKVYIWTTIWSQDINKYSKRDYGKFRDTQIGMLPPKLAQIMINISCGFNKKDIYIYIYDPFLWSWTVLIEATLMWYKSLYGSDINEKMINFSISNLQKLKNDWNNFSFKIFMFDARDLWDLKTKNLELNSLIKSWNLNIITEWFLWEIMTNKNICESRINIQRKKLAKLYKKFFLGLKKSSFSWNIVISFPFWELDWKYIFFSEIYNIISEFCLIEKLLPLDLIFKETRSGSLLYKRNNQLVWREIFKLKLKKF